MGPAENQPPRLILVSLGPVQPFIEAARTLRDLWAGSYLLSWLTAAAMKPVSDACGNDAFLTPHVDLETNALLRAAWKSKKGIEQSILPNLPNRFSAVVPADKADLLAQHCVEVARNEWRAIHSAVHTKLNDAWNKRFASDPLFKEWDRNWRSQCESYFEFKCVTLPLDEALSNDNPRWGVKWDQLGALLDMARSVRHTPNYTATPDVNGRHPMKCSLLGSFEQMGPADVGDSRQFWETLTLDWEKGLNGTRLQSVDRLSAISLVKRFAWSAYFAGANGGPDSRLGLDVRDLPFPDTATIAAQNWLEEWEQASKTEQKKIIIDRSSRNRLCEWNGQWLHWDKPDADSDDYRCPDDLWQRIKARKSDVGSPPAYYAILLMDGDHMGRLFGGTGQSDSWGAGKNRYREITKRLTVFSADVVASIVDHHNGTLIYSGGDDVLAAMPSDTAIACALAIRDAFRDDSALGNQASISAGLAIVNYKDDLRFALAQARRAERFAKRIGESTGLPDSQELLEKNALALTICRRSGSHSTVTLGWDQCQSFEKLIAAFAVDSDDKRPSDRWTYHFFETSDTLAGLSRQANETELKRLLARTEKASTVFTDDVLSLFNSYWDEMSSRQRGWDSSRIVREFATLCQSAGFLARGKD